jgi:hypothetical protein
MTEALHWAALRALASALAVAAALEYGRAEQARAMALRLPQTLATVAAAVARLILQLQAAGQAAQAW